MAEGEGVKVDVANLKERLQEMRQDMQTLRSEIKDELRALNDKYESINNFVVQARGGKALFFSLLTVAATLGAVITYFGKVFHG